MPEAVNEIISSQAGWAKRHGVVFDRSHVCRTLEDNLSVPLDPKSAAEFGRGAGDELGTSDARGVASLRYSSALAVNVFDAWRGADVASLGALVAADRLADRLRFEVAYPTGSAGDSSTPGCGCRPAGWCSGADRVEVHRGYTEARNEFRSSYFEDPGLWAGFERTRELATALTDGSVVFDYLGAAQLIKHALGLKQAHGLGRFR